MNTVTWALVIVVIMLAAIAISTMIDTSDGDTIWINPDELEDNDE